MAGFFSKLYRFVTTGRRGSPPTQRQLDAHQAEHARIRQTAADEHQARRAKRAGQDIDDAQAGLASIKAKIAAESAKLLESLGQQGAAAAERERQQSLEQKAKKEREDAARTPEERFLDGSFKLTLNIDFRSSNPPKPAVYQVWYVPAEESIYVTFFENGGPGRTYRYWTISRDEARRMYLASSKGIHIWDAFRVRGSRTLHKKNYAQV